MKSPFPGMDPYLEARWSDVHPTLLSFIKEVLQPSLPAGLRARMEERVILEEETGEPLKGYRSDIAVVQSASRERERTTSASSILAPEPVYITFFDEPTVDRFLHIIDTH